MRVDDLGRPVWHGHSRSPGINIRMLMARGARGGQGRRQSRGATLRLLACAALVFSLSACAGGWPYWPWADAPLHPEPPPGQWHVVKAGDTWENLARRAGVPAEDLLEINGVGPGQALREGQIVFLLGPDRAQASTSTPPTGTTPRRGPAEPSATERRPQAAEGARLAWPVASPVVSSKFGQRWGRNHEGIDLSAPLGVAVFAADDGVVVYADNLLSGYGNMVILEHNGGLLTAYAHNSVLLVQKADRVRRGQMIARVGQSGRATAPHLHFEVRMGAHPRDPLLFLPALK